MRTAECGKPKKREYHGMKHTKTYDDWTNIKARCHNPNHEYFSYYGGRGIFLAEEFHQFSAFYNYISTLQKFSLYKNGELSIDRIDNNKGYERGNIRFTTRQVQSLNQGVRRDSKTGHKGITFRDDGRINRWVCRVTIDKKLIVIGSYKTIEEAIEKYNSHPLVKYRNSLIDQVK
jgi:hypothetical protein